MDDSNMSQIRLVLILLFSVPLILTSCSKDKKATASDQTTPVKVMQVKYQKISIRYKSTGSISSVTNPVLKAQVPGKVLSVNVNVGDKIKTNQILAVLSNSRQKLAYKSAEAQLNSAKAELKQAKLLANSKNILAKKGIVSKLDASHATASAAMSEAKVIEAEQGLESAQHELNLTLVRSSISGSVEAKYISQGTFVTAGQSLFRIINHSLLQATLPFSQESAGKFYVGQKVHLLSPATPGKEYIGEISSITPSINPNNRALNVIVEFQNSDLWHAGASIEGYVYLKNKQRVMVIPTESVTLRGNNNYIFTITNNKAKQILVQILEERDGYVAVQGKIKQDAQVVTLGAQYLANNSSVTISNPQRKSATKKVVTKVVSNKKSS